MKNGGIIACKRKGIATRAKNSNGATDCWHGGVEGGAWDRVGEAGGGHGGRVVAGGGHPDHGRGGGDPDGGLG